MERKYLLAGIGIAIIVIAIVGGSYAYQNYKTSQIQNLLNQSQQHTLIAATLANKTVEAALNKNYTGAIYLAQQTQKEVNKSIDLDNQALQYADGAYKDYIVYDIMKLKKNYAMEDANIELYKAEQVNDVNAEYYANMEIIRTQNDAYDYRNKRNEIVTANPSLFAFLNS
ncbi:hypothetical protein [Methanobacterium sp.]|uniref:hypothetical protein n=1 Tax=Methanobacterium sp. TaxID=2164 RepID=UPI003C754B07